MEIQLLWLAVKQINHGLPLCLRSITTSTSWENRDSSAVFLKLYLNLDHPVDESSIKVPRKLFETLNLLFSTFIRFDSMKATFNLCSVYSWRMSSLAASIFKGFLEAWTLRVGLTARLCSVTEEINLKSKRSSHLTYHFSPAFLKGTEFN